MYDKESYDPGLKAFMTRKSSFWLLFLSLLLTLSAPPSIVDGGSEMVGVRIFTQDQVVLQSSAINGRTRIDYGAFQWMVIPKADLPELEAMGVSYQAIENPFSLNLGGEVFDPLEIAPSFNDSWGSISRGNGISLHLVQFQGPTKDIWLDSIQSEGLEILQYIHPFTYVVWGPSESIDKVSQNWQVRWTGEFFPAYAVQPEDRSLENERIWFRAMTVPQADLNQINQALTALGAENLSAAWGVDPVFDLLSFTLPGDQLAYAAGIPGVYSIQSLPTNGGDRGELSNQVNAGNIDSINRAFPGYRDWLNQIGIDGKDVVIANVDSGIDETHPDLSAQMLDCSGISCGESAFASNHGTHTAGIMAGNGSSEVLDVNGFLRGLGMAPGAKLVEQVYTQVDHLPDYLSLLMAESAKNGAVISGNSWGPSSTPLGYDYDTRLVDIGVRDADPDAPGDQSLSYILSIMNGYGGISTQGTPDEAKNAFTIGSTYMQSGSGSQYLNINDLSYNTAHGPALDGRLIPHMVAPGCSVDSTYMGGSYGLMCGTSMSSPHVSGAAALFYEKYRKQFGEDPSPAMVKAAFLAATHDLSGSKDADGGVMGHPFDAKQGWGRLDASSVLDPSMSVEYFDQDRIFNKTGQFWTFTLPLNNDLNDLRAMLVWTDAPGHGLGGITPAWVNDLDLAINIDGETYFGNNFGSDGLSILGGSPDQMNNTEGVFLSNIPEGEALITITASNIAGDGVPSHGTLADQDFALALYYSETDSTNYMFLPIIVR